ncbi:hypothetical protein M0P65_00975 [Candidatus Gracilibacteria bacterium]|nr:hypothetical protein [Candidatus Gracilibacteria bacterium]
MGFSIKSLFGGNKKENEAKKNSLSNTKPVSKPIIRAQLVVRDNFNHILPETKMSPDLELDT